MLSTGLVSLNIHEALTFDGTEIVLHPDLFSPDGHSTVGSLGTSTRHASNIRPSPSTATGVSSNGSITAAPMADSSKESSVQVSTSQTGGVLSTTQQQPQVTPATSWGGTGAGGASTASHSQRRLEVGDMIEVRVWDPIPARDRHQSPGVSTVFRKRSAASVNSGHSSNSTSTEAQKSAATSKKPSAPTTPQPVTRTNTPLDSVASNVSSSRNAHSSSAGSMQYSEISEHVHLLPPISSKSLNNTFSNDTTDTNNKNLSPTDASHADDHDALTNNSPPPPTKSVITGKPPIRGRANTTDVPRMPISSGSVLLKPPLQPRASTHGETFAAYEARKRSNKPIHSREISDMTADSVMVHGLLQTTQTADINVPLGVDIQDDADPPDDEEEEDTQADDITLSLIGKTHVMRFSFVMQVTEKTLTSLKGSARTQVSMLRQVADLYKLSPYDMVSINRIEKDDEAAVLTAVSADFVLVSIKDQFISRGAMHLFQKQLIGSWIYEGERLTEPARGIKAHAWLIRHGNQPAKSGIVTEDTMITFRSRSSRIFWLVQISAEMWDYASPYERERGEENESVCETYFDKWISFVHRLFDKWKALEVTHSLTVIFFSRTFLSSRQAITANANGGSLDCKDVYGRPYEDHYKVIIENETRADWDSLVVRLKEEFLRYPLEVDWNLSTGDLGRRPSNASQGNVLEAINITSNLLQFHYLDRDLHRTGNSIVVISPGCGVFEVDKGLASITYQRMMDNGIGSDVLSLGLPPLHIAPFFLYNNEYRTVESRGVDTSETYYEIPHWMHLAFVSYEGEPDNASQISSRATVEASLSKKFNPTEKPFPVAANGFILPRKDSFDSLIPSKVRVDPSSPTSFSVNGIAASSPEKLKQVPQERALNEGRDFLDILEACRPRNSGSTPSALQAILKMYRREKAERPPDSFNDDTEEGDTDELKPLREWTSMDLDLDEPYKVIRPRSGSFGLNERASERSDSSVLSSPSSSYTSLVGVSFDKHLLGRQKGGAPLGGIHLQRSQSLQRDAFDPSTEDTDTVKSDGSSWSAMGPEGSVDRATDDGMTFTRAAQRERSKHAKMLRKIQANHDSSYFDAPHVAPPVATDPAQSRQQAFMHDPIGSLSPVAGITHRFSASRNDPGQGGIGAALTHYTVSHDSVTTTNDNLSSRIRVLNPSDGVGPSRTTSRAADGTGGLATRNAPYDFGARGISPLLLPPPGLPLSMMADPPDLVRPEDRQFSSRLLPRDYKARDGASSRSLNTAYSGRGIPNHLISGELYSDQRTSSRVDIMSSVKSVGGGSPRASDLHRGHHGRKAEREKHGHRHRESSASHRRKKVFNPFRQADEDKVLAKRSHNRRRWSHVFPQGEIEFKRHAGPNWKSLTSPAILPLSVDYFPSRQEIDQFFQFNIYNVTLSDFEHTHYSTHAEVLHEMLRQRISQDYQLVPPSCVDDTFHHARPMMGHALYGSGGRATSVIPNLTAERSDNLKPIKHFLTMGHQLQELTYDPNTDTIEVVRFNEKSAQNDENNTFKYEYLMYEPLTQKYTKVVQTFKKYADQYNWNKVDRIVCGDEDKTLREGMRFRRLSFGLIPPSKFSTPADEQAYITKFKRLSEYLCKLKETDSATDDITVIATTDEDQKPNLFETRIVTGVDSMRRSTVQLRKGKHDPFEWIELATDAEFSTTKSYRIIFNWLAASSGKVDTQVQLLHRRCSQYGLNLVVFPQTSMSRDLLLNPLYPPPTFCIRDDEKARLLYTSILDLDFVNDGVFYTQTKPILQCIENGDEFDFGRRLSTAARQYIHRSGTLFARLIRDRHGWVIVVVIANSHHIQKDEEKLDAQARSVFRNLCHLIASMTADEEES